MVEVVMGVHHVLQRLLRLQPAGVLDDGQGAGLALRRLDEGEEVVELDEGAVVRAARQVPDPVGHLLRLDHDLVRRRRGGGDRQIADRALGIGGHPVLGDRVLVEVDGVLPGKREPRLEPAQSAGLGIVLEDRLVGDVTQHGVVAGGDDPARMQGVRVDVEGELGAVGGRDVDDVLPALVPQVARGRGLVEPEQDDADGVVVQLGPALGRHPLGRLHHPVVPFVVGDVAVEAEGLAHPVQGTAGEERRRAVLPKLPPLVGVVDRQAVVLDLVVRQVGPRGRVLAEAVRPPRPLEDHPRRLADGAEAPHRLGRFLEQPQLGRCRPAADEQDARYDQKVLPPLHESALLSPTNKKTTSGPTEGARTRNGLRRNRVDTPAAGNTTGQGSILS